MLVHLFSLLVIITSNLLFSSLTLLFKDSIHDYMYYMSILVQILIVLVSGLRLVFLLV